MGQLSNFLVFLRILVIFMVLYAFIPQLFLRFKKGEEGILDRFFMGITAAVSMSVILVHVLAFAKLYDVMSLIIGIIIILVLCIRSDKEKAATASRVLSKANKLFDIFESKEGFIRILESCKHGIMALKGKSFRKTTGLFMGKPVLITFTITVFTASFYIRLKHSLLHAAYPHIDVYIHLKWIKQLSNNLIYYIGEIYPKGMHSVYSSLSKLIFTDPYWLCRFLGPVFGALIVLAVYYAAYKFTSNRYAALFAMAVYGLTDSYAFPSIMYRQAAALSQEFAMLFVLLGLVFIYEYLNKKRKQYFHYYLMCLFISFASHSVSGMYLAAWSGIAFLVALVLKKTDFPEVLRKALYSGAAVAAGFLPVIIGKLAGYEYHRSSIAIVNDVMALKLDSLSFPSFFKDLVLPGNIYFYFMFFAIAFVLITLFFYLKDSFSGSGFVYSAITVTVLLSYFVYQVPSLLKGMPVPELLDKSRTGPFLAPLLVIFYALLIHLFFLMLKKTKLENRYPVHSYFGGIVLTITLVYIVMSINMGFFAVNPFYKHIEYDASAENYLRIKDLLNNNEGTNADWTIVATDTQLAEVVGYGLFEEIYNFVRKYKPEEAKNPEFKFLIPTHNIFIYVEKKPMFYDAAISIKDAEKEMEPEIPGEDVFMKYYQTGSNRALLQAKAMLIAENYLVSHQDVSVFYEDDDLKIYWIKQKDLSHIIR